MATPLQYIIDDERQKTSVVVPYKKWKELNQRYEQLYNKVQILNGIQEARKEVAQVRKIGKELQTLTDFLHENRD